MKVKCSLVIYFMLVVSNSSLADALKFVTIEVPPWASRQSETEITQGAFPSVVREIERRIGQEITISLTPVARIIRELETGQQDCTILVTNSDLASVAHVGETVFHHSLGVLAREGVTLASYDDLSNLTISALRGVETGSDFDHDESLNKVFDTNYLIGLRKLNRGRVDAVFGAIPTIMYLAKQNGFESSLGDSLILESAPLHLQCSKKTMSLAAMSKLEQAIQGMRDDGVLESIKEKYDF